MFKRYISLYYSSFNYRHSVYLLKLLIASAWKDPAKARNNFAESVKKIFGDFTVLPFSCGRGATAACLKAAGVGKGSEVLLSSFTCIAVPTAILAAGATPVYTDINSRSLNVTPEIILRSISPKTKAIILQHTFGCSSDVQKIIDVIKDRNILLIEDCALALGSKQNDVLLGSSADAAIFSLEQSKAISTGWGGLLIIKNKALAKIAINDYASVAEQKIIHVYKDSIQTAVSIICHHPSLHFIGKYIIYFFFKIGLFRYSTPQNEVDGNPGSDFISKLSGTQSALGLKQWRRLSTIVGKCRSNADCLRKVLKKMNFETLSDPISEQDEVVSSRISFLVKDPAHFHSFFNSNGIETASWFDGPLSPLPASDAFNYDVGKYPVSFFISRHIVNLPCHSRLTSKDLQLIIKLIIEYSKQNSQQHILNF